MKILLSNYRYFVSGGPERYMFNVAESLAKRGNEVVPFSIHYSYNRFTEYSKYFVKPLSTSNEVYFREQKLTVKSVVHTLSRLFYARDVEQAVTRLIKDTQPQIAYILHYLRKMSPSLLVGLKRAGLPIVVRLSDFGMLCPQAHFLRNSTPCELCRGGNLFPSLKYRCVQGSLAPSALNMLSTKYHHWMHYFDLVDMFVTTTHFMYRKMLEAGYPEHKLSYIPTFVNHEIFRPAAKNTRNKYLAYVGRLEHIKGLHILLDGLARVRAQRPETEISLKIAGTGDDQYIAGLKDQVLRLGLTNHVLFLGQLPEHEVSTLLSNAYLSIVPSLWYENLPNTILESYASGTPVLSSNLGSLTECIESGVTGSLFQPGDAKELAEQLLFYLDSPERINKMGINCRKLAEATYSEKQHLENLLALFAALIGQKDSCKETQFSRC